MALPDVALHDPHVEAHNDERHAINDLEDAVVENTGILSAIVSTLTNKLDKVFARTDEDENPVFKTEFTGVFDSEIPNIMEHWVNGTMHAGINEWGAVRGWRIPFTDALVRAIRVNGDGGSIDNAICFHIDDRRTGAIARDVYGRRYNGTLVRNGLNMADCYVRESDQDPIPEELPAGTLVFTKGD